MINEPLIDADISVEREMVKVTFSFGDEQYGFITSKKMLAGMRHVPGQRYPVLMEMKVFPNE